ncbi:hypothetical protein [Isoptericola rhizosphaerae]|uniref:hypothetical protein n=1 Tax=Isoptericola rhizosphaerae TaxID=3377837 RepID=UPI00383B5E49
MPKPSRTDALTFIAVAAGILAVVAFALGNPDLGGAALAVTAVVIALLVHSIARHVDARHGDLRSAVGKNAMRIERLEGETRELSDKAHLIVKSHKRTIRAVVAQGDRIEERTEAMSRRILADLSAARLEVADSAGR